MSLRPSTLGAAFLGMAAGPARPRSSVLGQITLTLRHMQKSLVHHRQKYSDNGSIYTSAAVSGASSIRLNSKKERRTILVRKRQQR